MGFSLGSALGLGGGSTVVGTLSGAALSGGMGYLGVRDTNRTNRGIASARNLMEVEEAKKARDFSAGESKLNRSFQERMSSTAVSRRMKDMKEAGINPILAGKFDASSPAGNIGATAKANAFGYEHQNELQGALSNAHIFLDLKRKMAEIDNIKSTTGLTVRKKDLTDVPADVLGTVEEYVKPVTSTLKKYGVPGHKAAVDITSRVMEKVGDSAKSFKRNYNTIERKAFNWIDSLKRDIDNFSKSFRTYRNLRSK